MKFYNLEAAGDLTVQTQGKVTFDLHGVEHWISCLLISPGCCLHLFLSKTVKRMFQQCQFKAKVTVKGPCLHNIFSP